jgi:zinc/manganese transport system substrate-binding protein
MMVALLALPVLLASAACGSDTSKSKASVRVVSAENVWGDIAAQIGGSQVEVTSIITDPNTDPHEYEASTRNAGAVARAGLVIQNGLGYDDFMSKLLSTASASGDKVLRVDKVMGIVGDNPNPHLWYDLPRLAVVAGAIADRLSQLDPAHAGQFRANATAFTASLQPIMQLIDEIASKYRGSAIAYTERVAGYLVEAAGLTVGIPASFAQSVEDGNDPSARDTTDFDDALTAHRVKALLYNDQVTDNTTDKIKALAIKSGVPVVGVSETLPASDKHFQAWQLRQTRELLAALGG